MTAQEAAREAARRWEVEVRDPANAAAAERRGFIVGKAAARWSLAPIPGGWAWRASVEIFGADYSGTPWRGPLPTREAAEDAALDFVDRFLGYRVGNDAAARLRARIAATRGQGVLL